MPSAGCSATTPKRTWPARAERSSDEGSRTRGTGRMTVVRGQDLRRRHVVDADVCVVGTGAGGAVAAAELAEGGLRVVMVEEGEHLPTARFNGRPRDMSAALYRDAAQTVTLGNTPIVLPLGRG